MVSEVAAARPVRPGNPASPRELFPKPFGGASDETDTMLFRIHFEIGIYPDRIQVSDLRSGRFVDFAAEVPFSAPSRLVADPIYFENALVKAMRKAMSGGFILLDAQADVSAGGAEFGASERQMVRRALRDIGFKTVRFGDIDDEEPPPLPPSLSALL